MSNASLAPDVVRLVIAARIVAFEDKGEEAIKELDEASEAFADRVPWDDEPSEDTALSTPNAPVEREAIALEARLEQVAKVMRSARAKNIPMEVWADDLKAVEDAILAVRLDEAAIRKDEREKCAKVAEDLDDGTDVSPAIASAIRNGGKQP